MYNPAAKHHNLVLSIVTWNHEDSIGQTLDSILRQDATGYHVVVFDNNSSDRTLEKVRAFSCDRLTIIENKENTGFCGGHNYVLRQFSYDYIMLVNPDVVLKDGYIKNTVAVFKKDPLIGAVCGLLIQSDDPNPTIDSMGMELQRARRFVLINHGKRLNSVHVESGYVTGMDGALPTFRKEAVESVMLDGNFFNPMFFAHKEDWDVSWRLLLYGWKSYFSKESIAIHPRFFKPASIRQRLKIPSKIKFHAFKNQLLLMLINDDKRNLLNDAYIVFPRLAAGVAFCLFLEPRSLKAFPYIFSHYKEILQIRKMVQSGRRLSAQEIRGYLK